MRPFRSAIRSGAAVGAAALCSWALATVTLAAAPDANSAQARLVGAALAGGNAFAIVDRLTTSVGPRLAGSPEAERAVRWALEEMRAAGMENIHREPVKVPRWVRGEESAQLVQPYGFKLHAVALGGSIGTTAQGVTADVVEVSSFEELRALGARARGKMVLFNKPMTRAQEYGSVVGLRRSGAIEAARVGAVAALLRSVGTGAFRLPHTGAMMYDAHVPKIPYAAVAAEDAELMHRMLRDGQTVRVQLKLGAKLLGEVESANVVGELRGTDRAAEVVLLGAHLDSWDLGSGAIDDGAGCALVLEAARLIAAVTAKPRRTVRVVLFMNEENGLSGARAYARAHEAELSKHIAAMELDAGAGRPVGFEVAGGTQSVEILKKLTAHVDALHLEEVKGVGGAGADLTPLQSQGVPVVGVRQEGSTYFHWHHTAADTLDKIDPTELSWTAAMVAVLAHSLANSDVTLPPSPPPARGPQPEEQPQSQTHQ